MNRLSLKNHFSLFFVIVMMLYAVPVQASVTCKSMIFSNSTKVKRLYGKNVHKRILPASTAKVMTAMLVMEHLSLDEYVTVSKRASKEQPSKLGMKPGDKYKVRDLLYAIMLKSANDAAVVLAEAIAGTHWEFVLLMNKKAKEIGAKNTKFANANGLPSKDKQYSTAYDMYLIFRQAIKKPFFKTLIEQKRKTIYSQSGVKHSLKSHNKMLFFDWKRPLYGKTGWTRAAGACFLGTIEHKGDTIIMGAFGCSDRWNDIKKTVEKYGGIDL